MSVNTYLTPKELAVRLKVHPQTLRNWRKSGRLTPAFATGRVVRYEWADVVRALNWQQKRLHPAFEKVQS